MIKRNVFKYRSPTILTRLLTAASCASAILSASAGAATPPVFNPDHLSDSQLARVSQVCRTVMGLSPREPLSGGDWLGESRLDYWTSHYRGCVMSLSDTVQSITGTREVQQADHSCRAKGYATGSPDLALCVLNSSHRAPGVPGAPLTPATLMPSTEKLPQATGSFFYASPRETRHREELACAAVGIERTGGGALSTCVDNLERIFFSIDNPIT